MDHDFIIDGKSYQVQLEKKGEKCRLMCGEKILEAEVREITPNIISVLAGDRSLKLHFAKGKDGCHVFCRGDSFLIREPADDQSCMLGDGDKSESDMLIVKAPMPGKVIKLYVNENDTIEKNQTLVVVEAMKMENEIKARISGRVKKIHCSPGDLVDSSRTILELELEEEPEA